MKFALINARSLAPKVASLIENFEERSWNCALITESWLVNGPLTEGVTEELLHGHGIGLLTQNRPGKNGRNSGGGVAIAYKRSTMSLSNFTVRKSGCEILVARGKIVGSDCLFFMVVVYMPPGMKRSRYECYLEIVHDALTKIKLQATNPVIVLGGDINNYNLSPAFQEFLDFKEIESPPTRSGERLDRFYSNCHEHVTDVDTVPPLQSEVGTESDHLILSASLKLACRHDFTWLKYRTRDLTVKNLDKFAEAYTAIDWQSAIGSTEDPSEMTEELHRITMRITDECLPWRERKVRSTDDPWITDEIRRAIRRRKRRYSKWHRGPKWRLVKDETDLLIKESKTDYYKSSVDKLKENGSSQLPYRALKELSIPERPNPWTINCTRPGLSDKALSEELATYFVKITDEFEAIPTSFSPMPTFSSPYDVLQPHQVAELIRKEKKPNQR